MTKYVTIDHNNIQVRDDDDNKDIVIVKIIDSEIMLETKRSMISHQVSHDELVEK
jgi:septum formation topological specificity factor MinE